MCGTKGLGVIFHSGAYDRVCHGLSISLAASALGRDVKLFFTYWALEYLKKGKDLPFHLDREGEGRRDLIEKGVKKGHFQNFSELISQAKKMGAVFYACTNSMGLLNISRDELIEEVDKSMGITTFLTETDGYQILFI